MGSPVGETPMFDLVSRGRIWDVPRPVQAAVFYKIVGPVLERECPSFLRSRRLRASPSRLQPLRMLFSQKTKGFFIERNDHAVMLARTSEPTPPFTVEEMIECPPNDAAALDQAIKQIQ